MASLKGHTGSTGRVSAVQGRWHPLILSAGAQLAGPSPSQRGRLVSSSSSLDYACRGSINSHIPTAGHRLRDAVERDQSPHSGASFLNISEMAGSTPLGLKAFWKMFLRSVWLSLLHTVKTGSNQWRQQNVKWVLSVSLATSSNLCNFFFFFFFFLFFSKIFK